MISKKEKIKYTDKYPKTFIQVFEKWCVACGLCMRRCENRVFVPNEKGIPRITKPTECSACYDCVTVCPGFAITLVTKKAKPLYQLCQKLGGRF
jgi:NAD-dependent dihydropyrimidine dehydrogenase PreA subunit